MSSTLRVGVLLTLHQVHVFQSIPFLDAAQKAFASCQDFVHNFLPQHQARRPQEFGSSAEKELEDEIDTEAARVVRGDGTETGAGRDAFVEPPVTKGLQRRQSYQEKRGSAIPAQTPGSEDPSWSAVYLSSSSEDEGDFGDVVRVQPVETSSPEPAPARRPPITKSSSLSRLRATVSTIANAASNSASGSLHVPSPHPPHARPPAPPVTRRRSRVSSISMTSSSEAPPEPSIRRSQRSHPNISSLVKSWSESGPANQTRTYKPDGLSAQHSDHKRRPSAYT